MCQALHWILRIYMKKSVHQERFGNYETMLIIFSVILDAALTLGPGRSPKKTSETKLRMVLGNGQKD